MPVRIKYLRQHCSVKSVIDKCLVLADSLKWNALIPTGSAPCHQRPRGGLPQEPRVDQTQEGELDQTLSSPVIKAHSLAAAVENSTSTPTPGSQGVIPNGTDTLRWSPESTNLDCTGDEGRSLIGPPPESVELTVWRSDGRGETCEAADEASDRGRCCCCCRRCKCLRSGRVPAFFSVLASLLCAAGLLYALYFYVPIKPPDCPDIASRIVFTLCCCVVAAVPVLLGTPPNTCTHHSNAATNERYRLEVDLVCLAASSWNFSVSPVLFNFMRFQPRLPVSLERSVISFSCT